MAGLWNHPRLVDAVKGMTLGVSAEGQFVLWEDKKTAVDFVVGKVQGLERWLIWLHETPSMCLLLLLFAWFLHVHVVFDCSCFTLFSRTILETQRLYQGSFNTDGIVYFGGSLDKEERHQRNNKIVYVAA